jgi:hypothetical protein
MTVYLGNNGKWGEQPPATNNIIDLGKGKKCYICFKNHFHWYNWSARLCSWINKILDEVEK